MRIQALAVPLVVLGVLIAGCAAPETVQRQGPEGDGNATGGAGAGGNRAPVARINPSATVLAPGAEVRLDASTSFDPDGGILNYTWDLGDGTALSGPQYAVVTHAYAAAGRYEVALTIIDSRGATGAATQVLNVNSNATLNGTIPPPPSPGTGDAGNGTGNGSGEGDVGQGTVALASPWSHAFRVEPNARMVRIDLGFTPTDGAPARILVRALDGTGTAIWSERLDVPPEGLRLRTGIQGGNLASHGDWRLEAISELGSASVDGTLTLEYA